MVFPKLFSIDVDAEPAPQCASMQLLFLANAPCGTGETIVTSVLQQSIKAKKVIVLFDAYPAVVRMYWMVYKQPILLSTFQIWSAIREFSLLK